MKTHLLSAAAIGALLSACAVGPEASTQSAAAPQDKGLVITGSKIPRRDQGADSVSSAGREDFERARDGAMQSTSPGGR